MPKAHSPKIHLPNLDSLRFISAAAVFFFHFFVYMQDLFVGESVLVDWVFRHFFFKGYLGVNFFFVLSGFLITFLLFIEKESDHTISVKKFYLRRVFRIWPLFFLVVLAGFFIYPLLTGRYSWPIVEEHLPMFIFLSNFDILYTGFSGIGNGLLGGLWSISIEEQFYLVWPFIILLSPRRMFPVVALILIAASLIFRIIFIDEKLVLYFHTLSVMNDMLVGSIFAFLILYSARFKEWMVTMPAYLIGSVYLISLLYILYLDEIRSAFYLAFLFERILLSFVFIFIILEQVYATHSIFKLGRFSWAEQLGKYSYALYCFHIIGIMLAQRVNIITGWNDKPSLLVFFSEMILAFIFVVVISYLSYHFFEKYFLKMKNKYA